MQPDSNYYQSQVPQSLMLSAESPMMGYQYQQQQQQSQSLQHLVRYRHSCEHCRKRKIKCSGTRPICDHCLRRGIQCIYKPLARTPRRTVSAGSGGSGGGGRGGGGNSKTTPASRNNCYSPSNHSYSGNGIGGGEGVQPISIPTPNSNNSANPFLSPLAAASSSSTAYNTNGGGHHDIASAPAFHSLSPLLGYGVPVSGIAKTHTHDSSSYNYSGRGGSHGGGSGSLPKHMCNTPTAIPPHMYNNGGGGGGGAVDMTAMHSYSPLAFGSASLGGGGDIAGTPGSFVSSIQSDFPPDSPSPYPGGLFNFNQTMLTGYSTTPAPTAATPTSIAKKNGGHRLFTPRGDKGYGENDDEDENESLLSMSAIDSNSNNNNMMTDFLGLQMEDPTATMYSDSGGAAVAAASLSASMYEFQIPVDSATGVSGSYGSEQSHHQFHFPSHPPASSSASFHHGMAAFSLPNQFSAIPAAAAATANESVGSFRPGPEDSGRQRRATGDSNDSISSMPLLERSAMMGGGEATGLHSRPDPSRPSDANIAASSRGDGGFGGISDGILGYYFSSAQQQGYTSTATAGGGGGIAPGLTIYQNANAGSASLASTNTATAETTTTTTVASAALERGSAFDGSNGYLK
ncbi:hypothetical protein IWW48_005330 [Coemansia sp. RSA 1200]|nr:hypothetical protein IWW48_005330 [Coemansia sp. RSA 1200]